MGVAVCYQSRGWRTGNLVVMSSLHGEPERCQRILRLTMNVDLWIFNAQVSPNRS